eukprot:gene18142-21693_t
MKEYDCAAPYVRLLRDNKQYRLLFLSSLISMMGDWFNELACLTLLARYNATGLMISAFLIIRESPAFFFSPITGVVSDRFDRRKIMLVADLARMVIILGFLLVRRENEIWLIYVLGFLQFTVGSFFSPSKSALMPILVKREDLITANATEQTSYSSMMLIGASLGGLVSYGMGTDANYIIDSFTYLGSAVCVTGMQWLRANPYLWAITLTKSSGAIVWSGIDMVLIRYGQTVFKMGSDGSLGLGIILAFGGIDLVCF